MKNNTNTADFRRCNNIQGVPLKEIDGTSKTEWDLMVPISKLYSLNDFQVI